MAVHFIYRSAYETPLGRRIVHFPDDSLAAWFRRNWVTPDVLPGDPKDYTSGWFDRAHEHTHRLLGGPVYGFHAIWEAMLAAGKPPNGDRALAKWLDGMSYPEGQIEARPHVLQIPTDDDDLDLAVLMFDDHFAARHPDRVQFPMWEEQALPEAIARSPGRFVWRGPVNDLDVRAEGSGAVYLVFIVIHDTGWLIDLYGAFRLRGLRLPELVEHLQTRRPRIAKPESWHAWIPSGTWPAEMRLLRWAALQAPRGAELKQVLHAVDDFDPDISAWYIDAVRRGSREPDAFLLGDRGCCELQWQEVENRQRKDAEESHGNQPSWRKRIRHPTFVQVTPHLAQLAFTDTTETPSIGLTEDKNTQWILFDDVWAGSHRDFARSLLRWAHKELPL